MKSEVWDRVCRLISCHCSPPVSVYTWPKYAGACASGDAEAENASITMPEMAQLLGLNRRQIYTILNGKRYKDLKDTEVVFLSLNDKSPILKEELCHIRRMRFTAMLGGVISVMFCMLMIIAVVCELLDTGRLA